MRTRLSVALSIGVIVSLVSGCSATPSPSATGTLVPLQPLVPTPTPIPNPTPLPTPVPTPTSHPTPFPTPSVPHHLVADFQTCFEMWESDPEEALRAHLHWCREPEAGIGNLVAKVGYDAPEEWTSFSIGLGGADFSPYDTLTFFARGDPSTGIPLMFRIELKRPGASEGEREMAVYYLGQVTEEWLQFAIPLSRFRSSPQDPPLCRWDAMSELGFTFESEYLDGTGTIYLDEIYVERRGEAVPVHLPGCLQVGAASSPEPEEIPAEVLPTPTLE